MSSLEQCCHWLRNDVIVTSANPDTHTLTEQEAPLRHSTGTSSLTQLCPTLQMWRPWHREPDTARPERGGARMSISGMLDPKLRLVLTTPCYVPPLRLHQNEGRWGSGHRGGPPGQQRGLRGSLDGQPRRAGTWVWHLPHQLHPPSHPHLPGWHGHTLTSPLGPKIRDRISEVPNGIRPMVAPEGAQRDFLTSMSLFCCLLQPSQGCVAGTLAGRASPPRPLCGGTLAS